MPKMITRYLGRSASGKWLAILWLSLLFSLSRLAIFEFLSGRGTDLGILMGYGTRINAGELPFRDFQPEYPPLALLYATIPSAFRVRSSSYPSVFREVTCAVDCAVWLALLSFHLPVFGRRRVEQGTERIPSCAGISQCLMYIVGTTALGPLIYDRIDLVLGGMLALATIAMLRGREILFKLAIGTGIAFKLIPLVLVPMILARELRTPRVSGPYAAGGARRAIRRRRYAGMLRTVLLLALPSVISFGGLALLGGYHLEKLFAFHAERPIQIESGPASIEMVAMMFGAPGRVTFSYGGVNLEAPYAKWLVGGSSALLVAICIGSTFVVLRSKRATADIHPSPGPMAPSVRENEQCALLMVAVLAGAMAVSKVLSPQYFLFLLPVLVLLPVPRDRMAAVANWVLIAVIYCLTGLIFPWWYFGRLIPLEPAAEFALILRNELLVVLAISLAWRAWARGRGAGDLGPGKAALAPLLQ